MEYIYFPKRLRLETDRGQWYSQSRERHGEELRVQADYAATTKRHNMERW